MQGWSHISVLALWVDCSARGPCAPVDPTEIPHDQTTPAATAADDSGKPRGAIVICFGLQRREIPFELIVSNAIASMEPRALGRGAGRGHRNCAPFSGLEPNADEAPMGTRFHTHTQLRFKPSCRQHAAPCYFCSSSRSPYALIIPRVPKQTTGTLRALRLCGLTCPRATACIGNRNCGIGNRNCGLTCVRNARKTFSPCS